MIFLKRHWRTALEVSLVLLLLGSVVVRHSTFDALLKRQQNIYFPDEQVATAEVGNRVFNDPDSYTWIILAKETIRTGQWRINYTNSDNPPYGREVHWNSFLVWMLVALAWVRSVLTGEQIYTALENAAFQVNMLQLVFMMVLWHILMRRVLGRWPTLLGTALLGSMGLIDWTFNTGRPDHQTLHFIAAMGSMIFLMRGGLGWVAVREDVRPLFIKVPSLSGARWGFRLAGLFSGFGIWVGATVQVTMLVFIGSLVLVLLFAVAKDEFSTELTNHGLRYEPRLWWEWGLWGSVSSLIFYLIQYFPSDMGMRLEAIHPFYSISWLGASWLMTRILGWRVNGGRLNLLSWDILLAVAAMVVWPLATKVGPASWHIFRDTLIVRFQMGTTEGMPLQRTFGNNWLLVAWVHLTILPLILLVIPWVSRNPRLTRYEWTVLLFSWLVAIGYLILGFWQNRWLMFSAMSFVILAPVFLQAIKPVIRSWRGVAVLVVCWTLLAGDAGYYIWRSAREGAVIAPNFVFGVWVKRLARIVRADKPNGEIHVITENAWAPELYYMNQIQSVGSFFWQNAQGLRATQNFWLSTDDEEAKKIAEERRLDYVMVYIHNVSINFPLYLRYGADVPTDYGDILIKRLLNNGPIVPEWLSQDYNMSYKADWSLSGGGTMPTPQVNIFKVKLTEVR